MNAPLTIADVQETVAEFYGIDPALLQHKTRLGHITKARHIAMFISIQALPVLDIQVAHHFARHHTMTVYVKKAIFDRLDTDAAFRREFDAIVANVDRLAESYSAIPQPHQPTNLP